jgi:hypothetical protein
MSTLFELIGMVLVALGVHTLLGTGPAELVGGAEIVLIGVAADGIRLTPMRWVRRKPKTKRPARQEPLTNADIDRP